MRLLCSLDPSCKNQNVCGEATAIRRIKMQLAYKVREQIVSFREFVQWRVALGRFTASLLALADPNSDM